jgi:hypothetical protein
MLAQRSLLVWVLVVGGCGVEAVVVEPAPLDGAGKNGRVDAGFARCDRVAGDGTCARRPSGCRQVVFWTFCPWWPWSPDSPLLGECSLRHETSNRICTAAVPVCGLFLLRRCCGLGGVFLTTGGLSDSVLIGYGVHLLMIAIVPAGVWLHRLGLGSTGLQRVLGLSLRFNLALMELLRHGILLK